jgi:outer membrane protein assembly factor BamB
VKRALLLLAVAACGPKAVFGLTSSKDNDAAALDKALATRQLPAQRQPVGAGGARAYVVVSGSPKKLVAYDLEHGKAAWSVAADVQSRVEVGGDFVVEREGGELVARAASDGAVRWKVAIDGTFVGVAADARRAYAVVQSGTDQKPSWVLTAYDGAGGKSLWRAPSPGQLGAPAAQGGIVMAPFLTQWLSILDGATGVQLTRVRATDDQISFVTTTSDATWFGSARGVVRLDEKAANGARATSSSAAAKLPAQLARASYAADGFDPVQAGYSAADRTRVLWRADARADKLAFEGGGVAVHYFRYVLGLDDGGAVRWAYSEAKGDLVASAHTGAVIVAVSGEGEVVALDPATGAVRATAQVDTGGAQVLGATFDADGWAPSGAGEPPSTVAALVAIARDRDSRFEGVKELAVTTLAHLPGVEVTKQMLVMLADERTSPKLKETVIGVLASRTDPAGLPALVEALGVQSDTIAGTEPVAVGAVARAVAAVAKQPLDEQLKTAAIDALIGQLQAPSTSIADAIDIVRALAAYGTPSARAPLRTYLLVYRADPEFAKADALVAATIDATLAGGANERELIRFVADDPRTQPAVAAYAHKALGR